MAYKYIKEENGTPAIVINGWEQGIADSPETGLTMMRNVNLISIPGEATVNFATSAINVPPSSFSPGIACTLDTATHSVTWAAGTTVLYADTAVTFGSSVGGVTAGTVYWISNVSGNTFKIYTGIGHQTLVSVTDATNTFTIITFGQGTHKALDVVNNNIYLLDLNGRAWWVNGSGNLVYLGNTTLTNTHGNGLCVLGGFLFVFRDTAIDYLNLNVIPTSAGAPTWVYGWNSYILFSSPSSNYSHYALTAQDNGMYICDGQNIQSVLIKGNYTFDPATAATYTTTLTTDESNYALKLPSIDRSTCLAELGTTLLVGGILNKIYPWDRISTSFTYPVVLAENYTTRMVTTNSTTYVFAGNRGRIYQTNGANIQLFKKIPDHIANILQSSGADPYFTWLDAIYWKNQIYFSFLMSTNSGTSLANFNGLWALDISMSQNVMMSATAVALRMTNTFSAGADCACYVIAPNIRTATPGGAGLYMAWGRLSITEYGIDITTSNPYATGTAGGNIWTDLIPTGTSINKKTFSQIEFKLAQPLVSGESIQISARQSFTDSWTILGSSNTVGIVSDIYPVNFQAGQWIQFYIELFSTATTPSFVRLTELRLR